MRIPSLTNYVFDGVLAWIVTLLVFVQAAAAQTVNTTVDNTSPLLQYSPQPCFRTAPPNCSPEWSIENSNKAFNGSTTSTNGTGAATGLDILPRVALTFQGDSILFVPGPNSNASATVVVDDLPSILLDTSTNAFTGSGLDPKQFHTITVTFVPSAKDELSILEIDYFTIGQSTPLNSTTTLKSSTTLTPAPIPTSSSSPTLTTTSMPSSTSSASPPSSPTSEPANNIITSTRPAPGTIAAISLSAALLILLAGMAWLFVLQRRRRRQHAARREAEILQGTRMPSEMYGMGISPISPAPGNRYSTGNMDALLAQNQPQSGGEGKGKARMRESMPPPVHYTPWR